MIQQDHLQIFDLTLNVWAPLFVGNGSSYTKKEYMYNTRNGKVSFLDEQKFSAFWSSTIWWTSTGSLCLASSPISGHF